MKPSPTSKDRMRGDHRELHGSMTNEERWRKEQSSCSHSKIGPRSGNTCLWPHQTRRRSGSQMLILWYAGAQGRPVVAFRSASRDESKTAVVSKLGIRSSRPRWCTCRPGRGAGVCECQVHLSYTLAVEPHRKGKGTNLGGSSRGEL